MIMTHKINASTIFKIFHSSKINNILMPIDCDTSIESYYDILQHNRTRIRFKFKRHTHTQININAQIVTVT